MPTNKTEREIASARKLLGDARIIAFLRAAGKPGLGTSLMIANKDLDEGQSLDELFHQWERRGELDPPRMGCYISAKSTGPDSYHIEYGCVAGGMAGDGGEWEVTFEGDRVKSIGDGLAWIS